MSDLSAKGAVKQVQIEAVVIRADGTREDLGVISDSKWHRLDPRRLLAARRTRKANERAR
jgi:hypothetical protein